MKTFFQKIICTAVSVALLCSMLPTEATAVVKPVVYAVNFLNVKNAEQRTLSLLSFYGNTFISVEDAARISGLTYQKDNEKHIFTAGNHQVEYDGEEIDYNSHKYLDMKHALDQLSCVYVYNDELQAVLFNPQTSFVENLYADCDTILNGAANYDIQWIANIPGIEVGALYDIISGFKIKALWGGDKRERYENVLKGIMLPTENESILLSLATEGNSLLGKLSEIVEYEKEFLNNNLVGELFGPSAQSIYETLHTIDGTIPGLSFGDCYEIIGNAYGAKNSASLYINAVQYGLYNNKKIDDKHLRNATDNVYRAFDNERSKWNNIFLDTTISALENATEKLIEEVVGSVLSCNQFVVKIFTSLVDKRLGIDKKVGATLALLDCANIQKEALDQYYTSNDPLQTKYSMILYLRSCWYGYSQFAKTGSTGKWSCQLMEPLINDAILKLAAYSDDELVREVHNDYLNLEDTSFNVMSEADFNGFLVDKLGMHKDDVINMIGEPDDILQTDVWTLSYKDGSVNMDYTDEQTLYMDGLPYNHIFQIRLSNRVDSDFDTQGMMLAPGIPANVTMDGLAEAELSYSYNTELVPHDDGTGSMIMNITTDIWKIQLLWISSDEVINPAETAPSTATLTWTNYSETGKNDGDNTLFSDEPEFATYLGQHIDVVISDFGTNYYTDYFSGGLFLKFDDIPALFFHDPTSGIIYNVMVGGDLRVIDNITADLTYPELKTLINLEKPEEWYNQMDSVTAYSSQYMIGKYLIYFYWQTDPYTSAPYEVTVSLSETLD